MSTTRINILMRKKNNESKMKYSEYTFSCNTTDAVTSLWIMRNIKVKRDDFCYKRFMKNALIGGKKEQVQKQWRWSW